MVSAAVAPLVLRTKLYFLVRRLAKLANLPFSHVARKHQTPASPLSTAGSPATPPKAGQQPATKIDDDQEDDHQGNQQYFLRE